MPETLAHSLSVIVRGLEACGAGFLLIGFIIDTVRWSQDIRQKGAVDARSEYRQKLGRSVLIGLELLVAATIIKTIIVKPTLEGVSILALMILTRTILGWTIVLEINGRWPWQARGADHV